MLRCGPVAVPQEPEYNVEALPVELLWVHFDGTCMAATCLAFSKLQTLPVKAGRATAAGATSAAATNATKSVLRIGDSSLGGWCSDRGFEQPLERDPVSSEPR